MKDKVVSGVFKTIGTVVMAVMIILSLLIVVPRIIGYQNYVVITDSMEPTIPVGSVVYVKRTDPLTIKEGEIITFFSHDKAQMTTTHRVIENNTEKRQFVTKGDNNELNDLNPISYLLYVGKVSFNLPYVGYVLINLSNLSGKIMYFSFFIVGIIFLEIGELLEKNVSNIKQKDL